MAGLLVRGDTRIVDIYATEFMRMFEQYHFRGAKKKANDKNTVITLSETDAWSKKWYDESRNERLDRMQFAGTLPAAASAPAAAAATQTPPPPPNAVKKPASKKKASTKSATTKTPAKKAASKKVTPKKAAPTKAASKRATPKKVTSKKTASRKTTPKRKKR